MNIALPPRGERLTEVADPQLIQHDPERIHIGHRTGSGAVEELGCEIHQAAGQRRLSRRGCLGQPEVRDAERLETFGLDERGAPEIDDANFRSGGSRGHDDVRGLEILVDDAGVMRGGDGASDVDQEMNAGGERNLVEPVLLVRPFDQVGATVFARHRVGRCVEIPLEHANQIAALSKRLAQETRDGHLAFQAFQP